MLRIHDLAPGTICVYHHQMVGYLALDNGVIRYSHMAVKDCPDRRCDQEDAFHETQPVDFACNATIEIPADPDEGLARMIVQYEKGSPVI